MTTAFLCPRPRPAARSIARLSLGSALWLTSCTPASTPAQANVASPTASEAPEADPSTPEATIAALPPVEPPADHWQPPPIDPSTPVGRFGPLHVEGQHLVDEAGTPVQLKGISSMWLNWEDRFSQSKEGLQWLRDHWKLSLYRVALGVEPDNAYLAAPEENLRRLRTAVRHAIELGLYVIIDWHAHHAQTAPEAAEAFFSQMAKEFGSYPNVLYETFNEPLGGDSWSETIKPYHERMVAAIRANDPDSVILLGNRQWDQRPDEAIADPVVADNVMYTVHFYSCDHQQAIRDNAEKAYRAGLALFATEWGATPADGGAAKPVVCEDSAQQWHEWMDARKISWAAWKFDTCADSSCFFNRPDVPVHGGWTDQWLTPYSKFIRSRLLADNE